LPLGAFLGSGEVLIIMPFVRLGPSGGLLGAADGVFLEVGNLSLLAP
jgi:hypothetical protein